MNKLWHYTCIAMIHTGLLLCPVGVKAACITIQVGQHQTFLGHNRVEQSPTDTDTPLNRSFVSVYQEGDWFNWPIYAGDGTPLVDFQLVYDGRSVMPTPETSTWVMVLSGLLTCGLLKIRKSRVARAVNAPSPNDAC